MNDQDIERILHRAAELQAGRTQKLGSPPALTAEEDRQLSFVAAAAEEAGIPRADFALATAEVTGSPQQKPVDPQASERARRWLGQADRAVSLEARAEAPAAEVLAALKTVLGSTDYQVEIANLVGENPLTDGVLVLEPADYWQMSLGKYSKFRYAMAVADFRQVLITIRPDPAAEDHTILRFHAALDHAAWLNHLWGLGLSGTFGGLAGLAAGAFATMAAGPLAGVAAGVALGAGVYLGLKAALGAAYRWATRHGQKALQELAGRVVQAWRFKGL